MWHLAARVQNELIHAAVPIGDRAASLHRSHALAGCGNLASDLDRRIEGRLDIDIDERLKERVVAPLLVQERRVRQSRRQHIVHGREFLQIDLDARGDILSLGSRSANAHCNELADLPHLLVREHWLLRRLESREAGHGDDWLHANKVRGGERLVAMFVGNVNGTQLCVGERRANKGDVLHAREADVADKLAAPAQEAVVLLTLNRGAYALIAHLLTFLSRDPRQVVWLASRS